MGFSPNRSVTLGFILKSYTVAVIEPTNRKRDLMYRLGKFLPLFILLAIGIAVLSSGVLGQLDPQALMADRANWQTQVSAHRWISAAIYVGVIALATAIALPGVVVMVVAGGMLFGLVTGTLLSTIGLIAGSVILFAASRAAFASGARPAPLLVNRLRDGYHAYPFNFTMFLRLVPLFPFGAVTIALAWLRCPLWLFVVTSTIGGAIMVTIESALGSSLLASYQRDGVISLHIFSHPGVILPLLGLGLLALAPVAIGMRRRRR